MPLGANKASLLGAAGSGGAFEASGGTETTYTDGGVDYKVHSFTASGELEVTGASGDVDILIVAGGGGGGGGSGPSLAHYGGSGAGGGGMLEGSSIELNTGTYTATVGDGGAGGTYLSGGQGEDSVFTETTWGTATADGGGYGLITFNATGVTGGSASGGSAFGDTGEHAGGTASQGDSNGLTGYGNDGGFGFRHPAAGGFGAGGGGGGAGGAGGNSGGEFVPGSNGLARNNLIRTGSNVAYAQGGTGAATSGGGGGASGGANTGTGGTAGNGGSNAGGAGGSGIIVIRYVV
tara:strand:- start:454 stop:1329 length:876 start_codon:yes stop_codon:yes gene_type:complete